MSLPTVISFSVPAVPDEPMVASLRYDGLRLAYVHRDAVGRLDDSWRSYGVYILLGRDDTCGTGEYRAYVGQAQALAARVPQHRNAKPWASHALLIARPDDPDFAFNLAEIGWLEGRLHAMLERAQYAVVENRAATGSSGLDATARSALESLARPVSAALRTLGYPTVTPEQSSDVAEKASRRTNTYHGVTVAELIEAGLLADDTVLHPTTSLYEGEATVTSEGTLVVHGVEHSSPSPAASQVTGGPRNGWEFWGVASGDGTITSLKDLRTRLGDTTEPEG